MSESNSLEIGVAADKVRRLYEYERTKNLEDWAALWADDAVVRFVLDVVPGKRDVYGKEAIVAWTAAKFVDRASSTIDDQIETIVGGLRVVVRLGVDLVFNDGAVASGPFLVIFTFNSDGLIVLMEEYVNELTFPVDYRARATAKVAASKS